MLNERVEMTDIDPSHWLNLTRLARGRLLASETEAKPAAARPRKTALRLIVEKGVCLRASHSQKGILRRFEPESLSDLEAIARKEEVDTVVVIERGVPRQIMHCIQSRLSLDMNLAEQGLVIYSAIREEMGQGIRVHPRPKMPEVNYSAISTIVKTTMPMRELVALVIHSEDGAITDSSGLPIVTSLITRLNDRAEIDLLTTTDSLVASGLELSDWRRDYGRINELAQTVWKSKLFLALHIPLGAMGALARAAAKDGPKALLGMAKSKEIIIDPFPLRLKALLKMGGMMKR